MTLILVSARRGRMTETRSSPPRRSRRRAAPAAIIGAAAPPETPSFSSSILTSWEAPAGVKPLNLLRDWLMSPFSFETP